MNYKRRAFLRQAALLLASIGVSQTTMAAAAHRYYHALAKPTVRKLALLVGIDHYSDNVCGNHSPYKSCLTGCATDVELQRELLTHRFGFEPNDILVLVNEDATRQAIEDAFLTHLVDQARPGDVVVFHFSGLGSQVALMDDATPDSPQIYNSLVPVDGVLPTREHPVLNDFMEDSLMLLLRSLATEHIVTVLDVSYGAPEHLLDSGLRVRARVSLPQGRLSNDEIALQTQLLQRVRGTRESIKKSQFPGLFLQAADSSQGAIEGQWNGFSAGLLTCALTQQLWWLTADTSLITGISLAGAKVEQAVGSQHQPVLTGKKSEKPAVESHRFKPIQPISADGVVTKFNVETASAQIFLGGLPAAVLENYGTTSILHVVASNDDNPSLPMAPVNVAPADELEQPQPTSTEQATVAEDTVNQGLTAQETTSDIEQDPDSEVILVVEQDTAQRSQVPQDAFDRALPMHVRSRDGISVQTRLIDSQLNAKYVKVGQLVHEHIRVLSKNINLVVALDSQLERIERVDATSALSGVPKISSVVAGEQPADVLFGKQHPLAAASSDAESQETPGSSSPAEARPAEGRGYGLFYLSREAIPNTLEDSEEAVKTAVHRVAPKLENLLATKLLRLTENPGSSQLGVQATLEMLAPQERILIQQTTFRAPWTPPESRLAKLFASNGKVPSLPIGSKIHYRLQNYGDRPVYCVLWGLDSGGNAITIYPVGRKGREANEAMFTGESMIAPGEIITMPQTTMTAEWSVGGPIGLSETYVVCSRDPLKRTAEELSRVMRPMGSFRQLSVLSEPMAIVQAMLADLTETSRNEIAEGLDVSSDNYALHMSRYASLSFIYRVVEA